MSGPASNEPAEGQVDEPVEYEFSAEQNTVFAELANVIRFVGTMLLLFGGLGVAAGVLKLTSDTETKAIVTGGLLLGEGVIGAIIGTWLRLTSIFFDDVATTDGADISNLMHALRHLGRVFRLQAYLLGLGLLIFVIILGLLVVSVFTG
jgi:mannose/fructose/N-acetylgalactosamine-specific phosphotransferase system component IID